MIAIDTNVLVRLLVRDDSQQAAVAERAVRERDDVLLPDTVLLETEWVLRSVYGIPPREIAASLERMLTLATPQTPLVREALHWFADGMDLGDALHLAGASTARCEVLLSFDKQFIKAARGRTPCTVKVPD